MRRAFGILAGVVAAADLVVARSLPRNVGLPLVPLSSRVALLGYGMFLLAVSVWAVATSLAKARSLPSAPAPADVDDGETRRVMQAWRASGWYVADDLELAHAHIDHVAIGPAGVIAVQVMRTDRPDRRGASARARIAAQQLRRALAAKELRVEVVPAVLAFGPGLPDELGGVKVVDSVAILVGPQADLWIAELGRRRLLPDRTIDAVRSIVADLREGMETGEPAPPAAALRAHAPTVGAGRTPPG